MFNFSKLLALIFTILFFGPIFTHGLSQEYNAFCIVTQSEAQPNELQHYLIQKYGDYEAEIIMLNVHNFEDKKNVKVFGSKKYQERISQLNVLIKSISNAEFYNTIENKKQKCINIKDIESEVVPLNFKR